MPMEIIRGRPEARGVTELMYVGDSEPENGYVTEGGHHLLKRVAFALGALGLMAERKEGGAGIYTTGAAVYLAFRAMVG